MSRPYNSENLRALRQYLSEPDFVPNRLTIARLLATVDELEVQLKRYAEQWPDPDVFREALARELGGRAPSVFTAQIGDRWVNLLGGQRVVIRENPEEGWQRQEARLVEVTEMPWGFSVIVDVEPEDEHDDGIRELRAEDLEL